MSSLRRGLAGKTWADVNVQDASSATSVPITRENDAVATVTCLFAIAHNSSSLVSAEYISSENVSHILLLDKPTPEKVSQVKGVKYLGVDLSSEGLKKLMAKPFVNAASEGAKAFFSGWYDDNNGDNRLFIICADQGLACPALVCMQLLIKAQGITTQEALAAVVAARPDVQLPPKTIHVLKEVADPLDKSLDKLPDTFFDQVSGRPWIKVRDEYIFFEGRDYLEAILKEIPRYIGARRKIQVERERKGRVSKNAKGEFVFSSPSPEPEDSTSEE